MPGAPFLAIQSNAFLLVSHEKNSGLGRNRCRAGCLVPSSSLFPAHLLQSARAWARLRGGCPSRRINWLRSHRDWDISPQQRSGPTCRSPLSSRMLLQSNEIAVTRSEALCEITFSCNGDESHPLACGASRVLWDEPIDSNPVSIREP